jgi:hypothetical protein
MVWNRNRDGGIAAAFLHDDVTAVASNFAKAMSREDVADLRA